MRYWGTEESVTSTRKARKPTRRRRSVGASHTRRSPRAKSSVTSGGSVRPFLRRFYKHQAVVSGPVQRVFLFLIVAGLFYAFILGDGGIIRIAMLRHDRAQLDHQIADLERNAARLETEITNLRDNPFFIEKAGRELFGYMRPDEHVYKIIPPEKSN